MLKEIPISKIKVGSRYRKDLGDLNALAKSIQKNGLLQPIGVTKKLELIFGERRLRTHQQILKKKTILARIVDVPSIIAGEHDENEIRKDFTPSERVAIAKEIETQLGNRQGQRTDRRPVEHFPQVPNGKKTREVAADRAGFGNDKTYRQAVHVVEDGTISLIKAMDDGTVSISAASILASTPKSQQKKILQLDPKSILRAAREIRLRLAEERAKHQEATTVKSVKRNRKKRIEAAQLIHGDCSSELKKIKSNSVDLILTDPPYPEINREYGRFTEPQWHKLMQQVVLEGRRILKPSGSMVIVLQPNSEKIGSMRLWLWEFLLWAAKEWNLVQDVYWWSYLALPVGGTRREQGLLRSSVKTCIWLGNPDCYRCQDNVLCLPSDLSFASQREYSALRSGPSGLTYNWNKMTKAVTDRGGSTPFNLLPIAAGGKQGASYQHPAKTPYDVAAWWVKYLLPQNGVLLDCFAGSGTMLCAGLDFGASKVIGIEKEKQYLKLSNKRLRE